MFKKFASKAAADGKPEAFHFTHPPQARQDELLPGSYVEGFREENAA